MFESIHPGCMRRSKGICDGATLLNLYTVIACVPEVLNARQQRACAICIRLAARYVVSCLPSWAEGKTLPLKPLPLFKVVYHLRTIWKNSLIPESELDALKPNTGAVDLHANPGPGKLTVLERSQCCQYCGCHSATVSKGETTHLPQAIGFHPTRQKKLAQNLDDQHTKLIL